MESHKQRVQEQFAASAEAYARSATHAQGDDLARLAAWCPRGADKRALDVATGAGHTAAALAPFVGHVVASDLTATMLSTARNLFDQKGVGNASLVCADAESLPFAPASFDVVSCRIAPHHFADVRTFVREVARVLEPGGAFLLEDSIVPDDASLGDFLNHVERIRDSTHVCSLSAAQWAALLEDAGFVVLARTHVPVPHPFEDWLDRARTPEPRRRLAAASFRDAPASAREAFAIEVAADGRVLSYTDEKLLLRARKHGGAGAG